MIHPNPEDPKAQVYCTRCGMQLSAMELARRSTLCDRCIQDAIDDAYGEYLRDEEYRP